MRQVSTLQQDQQFKIDRAEALTGFLGFYRGKFVRRGTKVIDVLWNIYAMLLMPSVSGINLDSSGLDKSTRTVISPDNRKSMHAKSALYRLQGEKRFVLKAVGMGVGTVTLPSVINDLLTTIKAQNAAFSREVALEGKDSVSAYLEGKTFDTVFTGDQLAARLNLDQRGREIIRTAVESVSIETVAGKYALVFRFTIPFKQAEYLGQASALDIKNANLYAFFFSWISSNFATDSGAEVAPYSVPMTKIAHQVNAAKADPSAKVTRSVNEDSILVTHLNQMLWLPEIDNTDRYEQALIEFGSRPDGSFSYDQSEAINPAEVNVGNLGTKKLPVNMPLLTDWVNRRFAYVNTSGNVSTIDLGACVPLNSFHIKRLLDTPVTNSTNSNPLGYALFLANATRPGFMNQVKPSEDEVPAQLWRQLEPHLDDPGFLNQLPSRINRYWVANGKNDPSGLLETTRGPKGDTWTNLPVRAFHEQSAIPEVRFVGRAIKLADAILEENLDVVFRKYSVPTVIEALATLKAFLKYCPQYDVVVTRDQEERAAYLDQGLDPNHKVEPLPNMRKDAKFQPHQARAENKMRRGPRFAIYEVDAGGGKSMMILTNILRELKNNRCRRPIIACPPHLVSGYVKEAVYFTEGKLNVVPITNITMKQHGPEKMTKFVQKAPRNTIFVTDFDFVRNKATDVCYGNQVTTIYKNAEFLRAQEFDLICVDESHYLRNPSTRTKAMQSFMIEIPMKRLASGTFVTDTLADVAPQFGLFDPTVFGTKDQFVLEYAQEMRGSKVLAWRAGAEQAIRARMSEHCVLVNHKRKEWAALLPTPVEKFFGVELTDNQRALYESILQKTIEKLREAVAKDPELKEALESNDDTKLEEIQLKLKRHLARLEAFLSTPETDEAGKDFLLLPEDKVSPKVKKIYERIREHLDQKIPGKILIFTNYKAAAKSVYDNAPPDIKKMMIHYTADKKVECKAQFETNANKQIMVGVENSMNTGLNFQFASRLIRMETVWTPGILEQGNSRVNRPNLKGDEFREVLYFDWIIINRTIDITKISRLISKMISKAKFDEHDNPSYENLIVPPQIPMTIETIAEHNDFQESLLPYLEAYQEYKQVQKADYDEYKARNAAEVKNIPIPVQGNMEGSALMTRVPYVPDMEIYGEGELGLVRYDQFVSQDLDSVDDDDDDAEADAGEGETDEEDDVKSKVAEERATLKGQPVHTEDGDGIITGVSKRRVRVVFPDGTRKVFRKFAVYIITRASTNSKDMRDALLKEVGELPLTEPFEVPVEDGDANKKRKQGKLKTALNEMTAPSAEFDITIINDYLALALRTDDTSADIVGKLSNFGFVKSFDYYYSKIIGPRNLLKLFQDWQAAGFKIDKATNAAFINIYTALKGNKKAGARYGFATEQGLRNWLRTQIKPTSDPKEIHPYPISQDENFYIALPIQGQAGTRAAIKYQPMNIRWKLGGGETEVYRFVTKKQDIIGLLKQIKEAGIEITNLDELKEQYDALQQFRPRAD